MNQSAFGAGQGTLPEGRFMKTGGAGGSVASNVPMEEQPRPGKPLPRSFRNNNPGSVEWGDWAKRYFERESGEGRFVKFKSMDEGLSHLARQLLIYNQRGINNVRDIIGMWAPPKKDGKFENNTIAYIQAVSRQLGVDPNQSLDMKDPRILALLMGAITKHEGGYNPFSMELLTEIAKDRLKRGTSIRAGSYQLPANE
jgi:hypothetical protein